MGRRSAVLMALALGACNPTPQVNPLRVAVAPPPPAVPPSTASWHAISFEGQSFTVKDKDRAILDQVVTEMRNKPGALITVIGRIDRPGSSEDVLHVSERRFEGVRDTLIYRGNVAPDRIQTLRTDESPKTGAAGRSSVDVVVF
jgi:outer membrane protein OmpA-like peptidoglycan-associated protein